MNIIFDIYLSHMFAFFTDIIRTEKGLDFS